MYVVLSYSDDPHINLVQPHLDEPFFVVDHTLLLAGIKIAHRLKDRRQAALYIDDEKISGVASVWYRRYATITEDDLPLPRHMLKYSRRAINRFADLIYSRFEDALWVSDPTAMRRAEDKLLQLERASRLGFNVPDTLITSSADEARRFVALHKQVIAKPLSIGYFEREGQGYGFYASMIDSSADFSGLHFAPAIFQQVAEPGVDIRVTVVGTKCFAATIRSDKIDDRTSHVRDWRVANADPKRTVKGFDLPQRITNLCVDLIKELGLHYGAIDLVLDKRGKYWFLENNPCGQWGFVELPTGQPIGKAIAQLLMTDSNK